MLWEFTTITNLLGELKRWRSKPKGRKKLAERRAKRAAKEGFKQTKSESNMHDIAKPITLEDLTNPEKKNDK